MKQTDMQLNLREHSIEGYERVVEIVEEKSGLHAIIAVHNTRQGPALGGIRAYPYASFEQAIEDALRLAKGMTYKSAIVEAGTGGGKSVIIVDPKRPKSAEQLLAFAEAVNQFQGSYICAEDYGVGVSDLEIIRRGTRYAVGLAHAHSSGDPSPYTAFGGFRGIQAVCKKLWGSDSVVGRSFAIQGLGSVGMRVARQLFWQGASQITVADINPSLVDQAVKEFGAKAVSVHEILSTPCDVFVPCALGGILNPHTIPHLQCKAIAGLANNQLLSSQDGEALKERGILYAPDFVINSGGLLNVCGEIKPKGHDPKEVRDAINRLYDLLLDIFNLAEKKNMSTNRIAEEMAEHKIFHGIGKRTQDVVFHH